MPRNRIKTAVGHPMLVATKVWGFAHLLSNGRLGDMVLFATLMFWSVLLYTRLKKRDRRDQVNYSASGSTVIPTAITVIAGVALWLFFALWLHLRLVGVAPFGA